MIRFDDETVEKMFDTLLEYNGILKLEVERLEEEIRRLKSRLAAKEGVMHCLATAHHIGWIKIDLSLWMDGIGDKRIEQ